jgi:hypothetical protein
MIMKKKVVLLTWNNYPMSREIVCDDIEEITSKIIALKLYGKRICEYNRDLVTMIVLRPLE